MEILSVNGPEDLSKNLETFSKSLVVLYFYVDDSAECSQMSDVINELSKETVEKCAAIKINATNEEIIEKYAISNVPAFVFIRNSIVVDTLVGANVFALSKKFEENLKFSEETMDERLKKLINKAHVMLFMKGNPNTPRCGFSKQVVALLASHNVNYETFDILEDYDVREALKKFSNWPTYPQLYVKGELIGGLDILKELSETGELDSVLKA